jgi:hypothetical protein
MTTDSPSTPAPAVVPDAPAVESPAQRAEVDLSDLQTEAETNARKAAEEKIFSDIETGTPKKDADSSDEDDEADDADTDEADEADDKEAADKEEDDDADTDETKARKRSRADRYRDRITRLEQENAQLRSRQGGSLTKAQINEHVESIIGPEPQEKDFDDYLTWDRERTAWLLDKRQMTRETERGIKAAQEERARRMADNVEAHQERVEAFRTRNGEESAKEFDAVMAKARDMRVSPVLEELILESGNSAHLQYFFARNPQRLDKVNRMSERDAAREIGQIEARLSLPQSKTKTTAPKPVRPPKGGAAPASQEAELTNWLKKKYG